MASVNWDCPHCQQNLDAEQDMAGEQIDCPTCGKGIAVPSPISFRCGHCHEMLEAEWDIRGESMDCPSCGTIVRVPLKPNQLRVKVSPDKSQPLSMPQRPITESLGRKRKGTSPPASAIVGLLLSTIGWVLPVLFGFLQSVGESILFWLVGGFMCRKARQTIRQSRAAIRGQSMTTAGLWLARLGVYGMIPTVLALQVITSGQVHQVNSQRNAANATVEYIASAIALYEVDCGHYPKDLSDLTSNNGETKWNGPYLKDGQPTDPWGHAFLYRELTDGYEVISYGSDGQPGGTGAAADLGTRWVNGKPSDALDENQHDEHHF